MERSLSDDPESFVEWAVRISNLVGGCRSNRLDGPDQSWWDFELEGQTVTLHREHYLGVSLLVPQRAGSLELMERLQKHLVLEP